MLSLRLTVDGSPILSGIDGVTITVVPIADATLYVKTRGGGYCGRFRVSHREGAWRLVREDGIDLPYDAACRCGWQASVIEDVAVAA